MNEPLLLREHHDFGTVRITLNRPAVHNAFDEQLIAGLTHAFQQLAHDSEVRVVVLAATGRSFCAGADIGWMQRVAANDAQANLEDALRFAAMMDAIDRCPKPVIARIQGPAYGGGVGLACAADIVIASERARFILSEVRLGILPAVIGPYLVNAVGARQARRLALSASTISAEEALSIGLVHQLTTESALDAAVERCVHDLLQGGPEAQRQVKELYSALPGGPITPAVQELTAQAISRVRATSEAQSGFEAFRAKRAAPWQPP